MPWYAIEYDNKFRLNYLFRFFRVPGIPCLFILNRQGKILSNSGTNDIQTFGNNAYDYWKEIESQ
jgi:hypothetical protein